MAKTKISSTDLIWIIREKLAAFADCPPSIKFAIIPSHAGWTVVMNPRDRTSHSSCVVRIEQIQNQLRELYVLKKD